MTDELDIYIGHRCKLARVSRHQSQTKVAEELGVSFQQIQKYEKGANRISASTLYKISKFLEVPLTFFFEDFELNKYDAQEHQLSDFYSTEAIILVDHFNKIQDHDLRKCMITLIKTIESTC